MPAPQKETLAKGERNVQTKYLRNFKGIYTKASRVAIPEDTFYDLTNLMPIGHANLHTIPNISSVLVDYAGDSVYWIEYANINSTDYLMVFTTNGKVFAYNIAANTSSQINSGNLLSGSGSRMDQWKNQYIVFADTNGYYYWDGTTFYGPYNAVQSLPSVTSATVSGSTGTIVFSSAHNLSAGWIITLSGFSPSGWNGTFAVATVVNSTTITISFASAPANATVNGTVVLDQLLPSAGNWGSPDIAVFSNRVWIYSKRQLFVSALNGPTDFQIADGSIVQNLTDPQLRGESTRLFSASGYLYIFGKSSIFVISDVYIPTSASPPAPVFSILNIQANIGSDQPGSIFVYNRDLMFANTYGLWRLTGVTAEKVSEDIDGTIQYLDTTFQISGGSPKVNNILQASFLIKQANDPVFGTRVIVANYFDQKWWFANYGNLSFITSAIKTNQPVVFGMLGNKLYQLYQDTTTGPATSWQTALWPMEDSLSDKEVFRAGFEMTVSQIGSSISVNLDTPNTSTPFISGFNVGQVQWQNSSASIVQWQNNSSTIVTWYTGSYLLYYADALGGYAKYVGISGSIGSGGIYEIESMMMDYELRKRW